MGRPIGTREVTVEQIRRIAEMSKEGKNRREISEEVEVAKRTVWSYQKEFLFLQLLF